MHQPQQIAAAEHGHRGAKLADSIKYWILPDIENPIPEGSIAARFATRVLAIGERSVTL